MSENKKENIGQETYYIYCIQNRVNNKIYIGWSKNYKKRWRTEKRDAFNPKRDCYNYPLSNAFRKYAKNPDDVVNHFNFHLIEIFDDKQDSIDAEKFWIAFFRTNIVRYGPGCGYNQTDGGEQGTFPGRKHTKEAKRKMSENAGSAKLNLELVNKIRSEFEELSYIDLAKKYNVGKSTIARVINNQCWEDDNYKPPNKCKKTNRVYKLILKNKKQNNTNNKLSQFIVAEIRRKFLSDSNRNPHELCTELCEIYCVSRATIKSILKNTRWKINDKKYDSYAKKQFEKFEDISRMNSQYKLNWQIVNAIRHDVKNTDITTKELAIKYNITYGNANHVINNTTWFDSNYDLTKAEKQERASEALSKSNKGDKNHKAILCQKDVDEIRYTFFNDKNSNPYDLAYDFSIKHNVNKQTIIVILQNINWTTGDQEYIKYAKERFKNVNRGTKHKKLNYELACSIRKLYKEDGVLAINLAKKYNVSLSVIYNILNNKIWK